MTLGTAAFLFAFLIALLLRFAKAHLRMDRKATPEEIKQHEEELKQHDKEYWLRQKYWHVLAYVDHVWEGEYDRWFYDDIEVIRKRMEPYDLDSMCDMTTTPNHRCICGGAGIRLR